MEAGSRGDVAYSTIAGGRAGIDLPINSPSGNMVICLGGGCTEASVMAMYSIVSADTLRKGGIDFDEAIISYVRHKYGVIIGQATAEQLKIKMARRFHRIRKTVWKFRDRIK